MNINYTSQNNIKGYPLFIYCIKMVHLCEKRGETTILLLSDLASTFLWEKIKNKKRNEKNKAFEMCLSIKFDLG